MISLRTHIASLVAIFLALAVGVALGAGPLQHDRNKQADDLAKARSDLAAAKQDTSTNGAADKLSDAYVAGTASTLLAKRLTGRDVAVVSLPGADPDAVSGVTQLIAAAGGRVSGTLAVTSKAIAPGGRQLVDALTSQMSAQAKSLAMPATLTTYQRLGYVVGRALGATTATASYDDTAVSLVAGLDTAGLAKAAAAPIGRGGLVLVVAGAGSQAAAEHDLVSGLAQAVSGVALLGPTPSAQQAGALKAVAADASLAKKVATIDPAETGAGRAVAVLALVQLGRGVAGSYGASGTTSLIPALH